jgi:hypothetical protein
MEPAGHKPTLHRVDSSITVQGEPGQVGLTSGNRYRAMHGFDDVSTD